ncbi:MAG TPA: hypothetical protein QGH10_00675 [Armatimonadota bacterium]|nr:hypothetical protein [Armatimonadota bacterium]
MNPTRVFTSVALVLCALLPRVAVAELPEGLTYDDGYAYFEVETHEDTKDGKRYAKGWSLTAEVRILGRVPSRSAFRMVVKKDGNEVASARQEASIYYYNPPAMDQNPDMMWHGWLRDREQIVNDIGQFDVEIYYIDGDDLTEHLARTHKVDVQKVTRVRGNDDPDAPLFYVNRHGEAAASFIVQRPAGRYPHIAASRPNYYDSNVVATYFTISASEKGRSFQNGYLRCTVNGEKLDLTPFGGSDQVSGDLAGERFYAVIHTAPGNVKEEINFRQYMALLPLTWGAADDPKRREGYPSISDHPGDWECKYIVNGELIRGWRFTVGEDGNIAPHPEESQGLSLGAGAHFVEMTIPEGGAYIDERLVPAQAKLGGFSGHEWQSDGAKAAAAAVPAKGTPAP